MPFGHVRAELGEALGVAQELDDLLQLVLGLVGAGDVVPADRGLRVRLDLLRLRPRHQLQRPPQEEDQQAHEDDREPEPDVVLDLPPLDRQHAHATPVCRGIRRSGLGSRPHISCLRRRGSPTRRISASAARPTSSWRSSGSRVPISRWISKPGAAARGPRRVRVALAPARRPRPPRRPRRAPPRRRRAGSGRWTARRSSSVPARLEASIGVTRCEPQRSCSLAASAASARRSRRRAIALCSTPW